MVIWVMAPCKLLGLLMLWRHLGAILCCRMGQQFHEKCW